MPNATTMPATKVTVSSERMPEEVAVKCPKCKGFCLAIEPPTHRLEQNVVIRMRVYCKRCPHLFHFRVTLSENAPSTTPPPSAGDA